MSDFDKRVQINKIIESQLPEFITSDFPKTTEFFKQYYISQEFQGGTVDIVENLDQYLKLDNLVPEVIIGSTNLSTNISSTVGIITANSTKGFPSEYGLLKIDDEIITYTGITTNTFTGCIRGFSAITEYNNLDISNYVDNINNKTLTFSKSLSSNHVKDSKIINLSVVFLQEFYKKLKYTFTPGFENIDFISDLDVGNFIKQARNFYQSKGIEESVKILFKILYGVEAKVLDLEGRLIKPSSADYVRRKVVVAKNISGNPFNLKGQSIFKSSDVETNASVSEVEVFTRNNETYYKIGLFVGYSERDLIEGIFTVPGKTKVLESVSVGSSIISVDSTIGFGNTGTLISGNNTINYTSKSVNQFFGCTGVRTTVDITSDIRSNETVYGYENGDATKRVDLRITGVISEIKNTNNMSFLDENDEILVKSLGEIIKNPSINKTYKQIFANSWIYNTSTRYQISQISGSPNSFIVLSDIDNSSLRENEYVDILFQNTNNIASPNAVITNINKPLKQITLDYDTPNFVPNILQSYDIRRKLKKSSSKNVPLVLGNNSYISNILNVYTDSNVYGYVASNSLPSYEITQELVESTIPNGSSRYLGGYDDISKSYSIIKFNLDVRFIDGDLVVYSANKPLSGLISGFEYYIKLNGTKSIRLYASKSLLSGSEYVKFMENPTSGVHKFTLKKHETKFISANKILRKFPIQKISSNSGGDLRKTSNNSINGIGLLIDGVEISNPESIDKIYYGPIKEFEVLNPGKNYDVINPPYISISTGVGNTALVQPIISGTVKAVYVDPQDFEIEKIISLSLVGGNGSGCILEPIIGKRSREVNFDSRIISVGGGVDLSYETISFLTPHNFTDGEEIIYNQNGNNPILTGSFGDITQTVTGKLVSGGKYIAKFVNTLSIKLFNTKTDYLSGINTIGFSTSTTFGGIHKFGTIPKNNLISIKVLNNGSGYQNRKLKCNSSGISTEYNTISFKDHGFSSKDIVIYSTTGSKISGVSTNVRYSIDKVDSNSFRLIDVGIGATITTNLIKNKYVDFKSRGSGYHIFEYPPIEINANVSYGSNFTGTFTFTPIVTGEIIGAYLYESGSGYGSNILNLHNKPIINLKNGKNAQLSPIISNGKVIDVQIFNKGAEYFSTPELVVKGDSGSGAILRPVINNGKISSVVIINSGIGYNATNSYIEVIPRGSGAIFEARVRDLTVNDAKRFASYAKTKTPKIFSSLNKNINEDSLVYGIYGYSSDLANNYFDSGEIHSPIIGWAYDGSPIYGPYGYSKSEDIQSGVRILNSGYTLNSNIFDRPSTYPSGFFIEDFQYIGTGDLDEHNGRFCKTPEFPNGIYAYFASVTAKIVANREKIDEPLYPYFIGNTFRFSFITENSYLTQNFDFNNSNLIRNTFPYKLNDKYADYDFLIEPYEKIPQVSIIKSLEKGIVEDIKVIDGGSGYRIGELVNFKQELEEGTIFTAEVSELIGKNISSIETNFQTYFPSVFVWDTDKSISAYYTSGFNLNNNDTVLVSGLSTSILNLSGSKTIGFSTEIVGLAKTMSSYSAITGGKIEDIFVSTQPNVSIGGSIFIKSSLGQETVKVLNDYKNGVLRVKRYASSGVAHTYGSNLNIINDRIIIASKSKIPQFESARNDLVYFNAKTSVGIGTIIGGSISTSFTIGGTTQTVSIPNRSIYLPNHPFKTGKKLTFTKSNLAGIDSLIVGDNPSNLNTFQIPDTVTLTSDVYIINKGKDYIGIVTQVGLTTNSEGLFFYSNGTNNSEYLLKTNYDQVTGQIDRVVSTVSIAQSHGLVSGDTIKLSVVPNIIVGVGTTAPLTISLNANEKKLLVNPTTISSNQINTADNTITLSDHGYKTGDKIFYNSSQVASGLATGSYYVIKDSNSKFRLADTKYESIPPNENVVNITGTGGAIHTFASINPRINVVKNSTIQFNLGDSSLIGYKFKIFNDNEFKNEFINAGDSSNFSIIRIGTVGFGTASLSIRYSNEMPSKLFYTLEKSGYISTADKEVLNYSEINYIDSEYNGTYSIFGISTDSFKISPSKIPSVLKYTKNQTEKLEYSTKSSNAINGSIGKVKIISEGLEFKKLPKFKNIVTIDGLDANLVAISTSIGKIKNIRIKDIGYEYSSDKTLNPEASGPTIINIDHSDTINTLDIINNGKNYTNSPDLLLFNTETKKVIDSSSLIAIIQNGSISKIEQISPIFGLRSDTHKVIAINNSNGVGISSIITSNSGIATCTLLTPIVGFTTTIFKNNDEIFVEGIDLINGSTGSGYNSENYGYRFFKVLSFVNSNPARLTFALVDDLDVGLSTNPGIAKTFQSRYASIINKKNYPEINVSKKRGKFILNEKLFVDIGRGFFEEDIYISDIKDEFIKVVGNYTPDSGNKIKGKISGVVADIVSIIENKAIFKIDYSSKQSFGWRNDIGKTSEDYQVTPDNDYYQNLSYSIKSPISWDRSVSPVNSILHPSGLKNFADVGIVSSTKSSLGLSGITSSLIVLDIFEEKKVDTINNFDNVIDYDKKINPEKSKFLKIQNRKLSDYIECRTNRVLIHDNVSERFSSGGKSANQDSFIEIDEINQINTNIKYTIQIVDPETFDSQITELILSTKTLDSILFEKYTIYTNELLGNFDVNIDTSKRKILIFTPTDRFNRDHDIKILKKTFTSSALTGIGTHDIGSINLIGSSIVGVSDIETIAHFPSSNFNGLFANIEITNTQTKEVNYIESILDFDGSNTYLSEYYFDTKSQSYSSSSIGLVTAIYDSNSGIVSFRVQNKENYPLDVKANIVSFASTSLGIGTYRFLSSGQPAGSERSVRLESTFDVGFTTIRVGTFDKNLDTSVSSIVRVSSGSSSAIHQVIILQDTVNVIVVQEEFSTTNGASGLGTFGGQIDGNKFYLNFYPDLPNSTKIQGFNEVFYTDNDFDNNPLALKYGNGEQKLFLSTYDGINGNRSNKLNFSLKHQGVPIYKKTFNPSDSNIVDFTTGIFTIENHFFNTGEELIYTPKSTFIGVGQSAIGIGSTANYLGIVTDKLPGILYPIVLTLDTFKLATRKTYASLGIGVTITNSGLGNAHELEMSKKLSKSVISLDGVVQQPITFTPISHKLKYNSGSINAGISTFNLSGISSIQPRDILKIDNEYMKVVEVGLSSNTGGNITGIINSIGIVTFPTVSVIRASLGSTATTHTDNTNVQIYRGSFNIVGTEIWFTDPPVGNTREKKDMSNLPYVRAEYSGRTFLRSNYDTNMIFDDISNQFTGVGKTFTTTIGGINTTGISIGNGILFINGVFQTPTTINNAGNNYEFLNDNISGISSVVFTGITSTDGTYIKSDFDINQNQLPRGGLIVSLGSTPGLGYAPLFGAKVKAILNGSGSIISVTGISHTGPGQSISTASYNNQTGIIEITTTTDHNFVGGDRIKLVGLAFTCASNPGIVSYFPSKGLDYSYDITGIISARSFISDVGRSTLSHSYIGFGTVFEWYDLNEGSGYRNPISIGVTDPNHAGTEASIAASVGAGGTLSFSVLNGGSGYVNPYIKIPEPIYENIPITGVSRVGVGTTSKTGSNLLMNISIGPSSSTVGIGSTLFLVKSFEISRTGYEFQVGDIFKPVGLVTAKDFIEPLEEFQLEVVEIFQDSFSSWTFGEMNHIDSISTLQDGIKTRFPLYYNGQLLSFQIDSNNILSSKINLDAVLIIFINGVIQNPSIAYNFLGGTSFEFTEPPKEFDKVDIFFYLGENNIDSVNVDIIETIKIGDDITVQNNPIYPPIYAIGVNTSFTSVVSTKGNIGITSTIITGITTTSIIVGQIIEEISDVIKFTTEVISVGIGSIVINPPSINIDSSRSGVDFKFGNYNTNTVFSGIENRYLGQTESRAFSDIVNSDLMETNTYVGPGIEEVVYKPIDWIKQKTDKYIKGDIVYKVRDSLEPIIYPTAKIIGNIDVGSTNIFVDNARFFLYENPEYGITIDTVDALIVQGTDPVSAAFTATVSIAGTISAITITNPGFGYSSSIPIKISTPPSIGIGIGTTATAIANVSLGSVLSVTITNPGLGYTFTNSPELIVEIPTTKMEKIKKIKNVQGFSGIITGISTTTGVGGHPLALKINFKAFSEYADKTTNLKDQISATDLQVGFPILIYNTTVGTGVTSVNSGNSSVVGIGTNFLDNVYVVNSISFPSLDAEIVCNIKTDSNVIGISTSGSITSPLGNISWGRLYNQIEGLTRKNPISIGVTGLIVDSGLSTFPTIQRRTFGLNNSGGIRKISNLP